MQKKPRTYHLVLQCILCIFLSVVFVCLAQAQQIKQVKGTKVLVESSSPLQADQEFYSVDDAGKKKSLIKITLVKGSKAIGEITKGTPEVGQTMIPKTAGAPVAKRSSKTARQDETSSDSARTEKQPKGWPVGFLLGYGMNAMSLTAQYDPDNTPPVDRSADVSLKSTSISLKAYADYKLTDSFFLRGTTGYEPFTVTGSATSAAGNICDNGASATCKVDLTYWAFEGSAHWAFLNSPQFRMHAGLGYSFLFTVAKAITIPNLKSSSSFNQMYLLKIGGEYKLSGKSFIPFLIEQGTIPGDSVKSSALYIRGGWGTYF